MKRFKFRSALLIGLVIFLLVACNPGREVTSSNSAKGAKTLVMATSADYPPYEFVEVSNGRQTVRGFDVDVAKQITEKLGYGLQINNIGFDRLIPALQSGQADFVMAGLVPTEPRRQMADFTQIYYVAKHAILSKRGSRLTTPESLSGKIVGVQQGSIQVQRAKQIRNVKIKSLPQISELIEALRIGQIEAALVAEITTKDFANHPNLEVHLVPSIPGQTGVAVAFRRGSALVSEFDRVISEMKTTGAIEQLAQKWFSNLKTSDASLQKEPVD